MSSAWCWVFAGVLTLAPTVVARPATATEGYPRVALYWFVHGDGSPLLDGATGELRADVADAVSRYGQLVLDVDPIAPYRPDVLDSLRRRNPNLKVLGFVTGECIWPPNSSDSLRDFPTVYWRTVRDLDGFLYNRQGGMYGEVNFAFANVNLAKRDGEGRYVVAEAVARTFHDAAFAPARWDGLFVDVYCDHITWTQTPAESIDFVRAGYPDLASFDVAWKAGSDTLASRLRSALGDGALLVGNCASSTKYPWFNGWMHENFPFQNGGTWEANMLADPGGYLTDEVRFRSPTSNYLCSLAWPPSEPSSRENARRVRYGLASAALGSGWAAFDVAGRVSDEYPYGLWWYDEYAVDPATGASSSEVAHTGWLGQPLAAWRLQSWVTPAPDGVTNPGFESSTDGWTIEPPGAVPVSSWRDTLAPADGVASLRVWIERPGAAGEEIRVTNSGTLQTFGGACYTATFRARASRPRVLEVWLGGAGGSVSARVRVKLEAAWQTGHAVLRPTFGGAAGLRLAVEADSGSVWLDDVHLQAGVTAIYRRDFERGVVLVNPAPLFAWVPMERSFRRIRGHVDSLTNDGSAPVWQSVAAEDALFLVDPSPLATASPTASVASRRRMHVSPNPGGPGALRLSFACPAPGTARLTLFDAAGRCAVVRDLGWVPAGVHDLPVEIGRITPGLYFARLVVGTNRMTTRWIHVR